MAHVVIFPRRSYKGVDETCLSLDPLFSTLFCRVGNSGLNMFSGRALAFFYRTSLGLGMVMEARKTTSVVL